MRAPVAGFVLALLLSSPSALARDWFVRAGSTGGDGSLDKPFNDPWEALDKCEAGDAIHIAGGKYFGRLGQGTWEIPFENIQFLGGYDASFKARDPWKNATQLLWDKTSKNWPRDVRVNVKMKGVVIDGITIDQRDQCEYETDEQLGRTEKPCESAIRFWLPGTVRNSVIVNSGFDGLVVPAGSTVENNLIVNSVNWGVNINSTSDKQAVATVKNNTIAFTWDFKKPGAGGYPGAALGVKGHATITQNILAYSDNNAVYMTANPEKTTLSKNVFFMNLFSNFKFYADGKDTPIDDKSMDELEEVGFKAFDGNEVKNPGLAVNPKWMDAVSKRTASQPGKLVMDDWNKTRQALGLPMIAKGGVPPSGVAPAMALEDALKLMSPKGAGSAGARVVPLEVKLQGGGASASKSYTRADPTAWLKNCASLDGKNVELVLAINSVANVQSLPAAYDKKEYAATTLHDPNPPDFGRIIGFYKKGSAVDRATNAAMGLYNGSGKPDRVFLVKGTAYATSSSPKCGVVIDSFEAAELQGATAARPQGRDWFVRAGSSGGDGSKEKPFKDPYQALEKAEAGDFVHVAEGEYFGKLKAGAWTIDVPFLSLIGGYDANFTERNPWKHPTRLFSPPEYKGRRGGYTIQGVDDHTGVVIDGFVFDKKTNNLYTPEGDLDYSRSDKTDHLWFSNVGVVIRNNVFLNGAEGALRVANGQLIENNIFINHYTKTVTADRAFGADPFVFKNNTVLFAWEFRFGEGNGRNGHLLSLGGMMKAVVDNNIFEFADNDAIRLMSDPAEVEFTNNTFSHNLWSHVMRPQQTIVVDDKNWAQLSDFKFKKLSGNQLVSSGVPLDKDWFDVYLNRTAYTPGKVQMDDWNQFRELIGQPVIATGGKAGKGMAPAYDWKKALVLFPKNAKVTSGARAKDFPVSFTGIKRDVQTYSYDDTTWDIAKDRAAWDKLDGKRVSLKVVIRSTDNQWMLSDVSKDDFNVFTVTGPDGNDSGGLPLRVYVKRGTSAERKVRQAKSYSSGSPEQWYFIKGVVRQNRQMVADVVERAD